MKPGQGSRWVLRRGILLVAAILACAIWGVQAAGISAPAAAPEAAPAQAVPVAQPAGNGGGDEGASESGGAAANGGAAEAGGVPGGVAGGAGVEPAQGMPSVSGPDFGGGGGPGAGNLPTISRLPGNAYGDDPGLGVGYSRVFGPIMPSGEGAPFVETGRGGNFNYAEPMQVGGAEGGVSAGTRNGGLRVPFIVSTADIERSDIKAGPVFVKFHFMDGLVLHDDNPGLTSGPHGDETLVLLRLGLTVAADITSDLQLAINGTLLYLPLKNQFGVYSPDLQNLGVLAALAPGLGALLSYTTEVEGWPVTFSDLLQVASTTYSTGLRDNFDMFRGDTLQIQDGEYVLHSRTGVPGQDNNANTSVTYLSNSVGAHTEQMLMADIDFSVDVSHENRLYFPSGVTEPSAIDRVLVSAEEKRENLRFNPYIQYGLENVENYSVQNFVRGGFRGPVDNQVTIDMSAGYSDITYENQTRYEYQSLIYAAVLQHIAGPYTQEELSFVDYPGGYNQEDRRTERYKLTQVIARNLQGEFFFEHSDITNLTNDQSPSRSTGDYLGLAFSWALGPKTNLYLGGIAERERYTNSGRADVLTGRAVLNRQLADDWSMQLFYQHQLFKRWSLGGYTQPEDNLMYVRVTRTFY